MGHRLKYYYIQATRNIKHSMLVIIAFSITLSLIAGLNYGVSAYQKNLLENDMEQIFDFTFEYKDYNFEIKDVHKQSKEGIDFIQTKTNQIDLEKIFYYGIYKSRFVNLFKDYSDIPVEEIPGSYDNFSTPANFISSDEKFYDSNRFNEYFHIIEGRYPAAKNEILIDITYAYHLNLKVGNEYAIRMQGYDPKKASNQYFYSNISAKIVGTFVAKTSQYYFSYLHFFNSYKFNSRTENIENIENISLYINDKSPIFTYYNFEQGKETSWFQDSIDELEDIYNKFENLFECSFGFGGFINRNDIKISNLNYKYNKIKSGMNSIQEEFILIYRNSDFFFYDFLSHNIRSIYLKTKDLRTTLLLIEIPIIIVSILLGIFSKNIEIKSRLNEFIILKSKGSPPFMLINQYLIEIITNSLISSSIAVILGIPVFYGFKNYFNRILILNSSVELTLLITWNLILMTNLYGLGLTLVGSIPSLIFILKKPANDLLNIINSEEEDVEYNEKTLFKERITPNEKLNANNDKSNANNDKSNANNDKSNVNNDKSKSKKGNFNKLEEPEKNKNLNQNDLRNQMIQKHTNLKFNQEIYKDPIEEIEKKIPKYSIWLVLISTIPLLIYLFIYLGNLSTSSDLIIIIAEFIQKNIDILTVFVVISPIFLVWGILRFLLVEKPSRFAKISKKISTKLLKERDYLLGIEMVRRKQFKTVILIIAMFTALFSFTNLFLYTTSSNVKLELNYEIGSDIKANLNIVNLNISNSEDLREFENAIKNYKCPSNGKYLFKDVQTIYLEDEQSTINHNDKTFLIDISKYYNLISENKKKLPSRVFSSDIREIIDYNKNLTGEFDYPGVIVNEAFMKINLNSINDLINYTHHFFNTSTETYENETIVVKIKKIMDFLPGLYSEYYSYSSNLKIMVVDFDFLNKENSTLHGKNMFQMIDVDTEIEDNPKILKNHLKNVTIWHIRRYKSIEFYDLEWKELSFDSNPLVQVFGIFYFDFMILGIMIAFGISVLFIALQKDNKYFNGVLLARGFGKKGLLNLLVMQLLISFLFGIFSGLFSGLIYGALFVKLRCLTEFTTKSINYPIFCNIFELFGILGFIVILTFAISFITFHLEKKKNISAYFHKF